MTPLALGALTASLTLLAVPFATNPAPGAAPPEQTITTLDGGTWPLQPPTIVTDFDDPQVYAPGHRGIDLAASVGEAVVAAGPGVITTAGLVAGRPLVVVTHDGGVRTTYLPVTPIVRVGDWVRAGDPLGTVAAQNHCVSAVSAVCLHWGARRGDRYVDPRSLLPLAAQPIVLLPNDP